MKLAVTPDFSRHKLLVIGDLMLDRYWHGDTSRISPEAPVPVVHVQNIEERPGGAANVALNIAALGSQVTLMGLTGSDEAANALQNSLNNAHIECRFTRMQDRPTITKLRVMSRHQQLIRLDIEQSYSQCDKQPLHQSIAAQLAAADVVVLSDYSKGTLDGVAEIIALCRSANKPVIIDPKGTDFNRYRGATLLTPNLHEFTTIVGSCNSEAEIEQKGMALLQQLELQALLITRSEAGMTLLQQGQPACHIPTRAREVFDVTGAGDTVVATLATALAAGQPLNKATELANLAAGLVVAKLGTATVSAHELNSALRKDDGVTTGMVTEEQLIALTEEAKAHGERVVMTNGCFDILHAGHVTYLEEAAQLGDRLIVAVNDDASVKRLKGEERPVNTQQRRMRVLAALDCVDWVVGFDEDTPTRLICAVSPDILVKGGDNEADKIPGGDCVRQAGGEVRVMSYIDNVSTTRIIGAIRSSGPK